MVTDVVGAGKIFESETVAESEERCSCVGEVEVTQNGGNIRKISFSLIRKGWACVKEVIKSLLYAEVAVFTNSASVLI